MQGPCSVEGDGGAYPNYREAASFQVQGVPKNVFAIAISNHIEIHDNNSGGLTMFKHYLQFKTFSFFIILFRDV